ncbi:PxKF domain-containing protein [Agromyces sp. NPDC055658]
MKRWSGWGGSIAGAATAAVLVLGGGAIAYADDIESIVTVDDLVVSTPVVDLGVLGCGTSKDIVVKLNLDRGGAGAATIFENGADIAFSRTSQTNVEASQPSPTTITLPGDWATLDQNSTVDSAQTSSTITVAAGDTNGPATGSVGYRATGKVLNGDTKHRDATVSVSWTVENCGGVDPVDVTGPVVVLTCPTDPIPRGAAAEATWTATDEAGGSGVAEGYEGGTFALDTATLGEHTFNAPAGTAVDNAGNPSAEASCTYTVVDVTPPVVLLACPTGPVLLGAVAEATWTATDEAGGSGVAEGYESGSIALDTSSVGTKTATAAEGAARDNAGNPSAAVSCEYSVIYDFAGFFRPVDMGGVVNSVKAGSAVPMKFSLDGDQGLDIIAAGYPRATFTSCDANAPVDAVESTVTAGGSSLTYDPVAGQYVYVWKTDKSWAGRCGTFELKLDDGVTRTAKFKFLK